VGEVVFKVKPEDYRGLASANAIYSIPGSQVGVILAGTKMTQFDEITKSGEAKEYNIEDLDKKNVYLPVCSADDAVSLITKYIELLPHQKEKVRQLKVCNKKEQPFIVFFRG
jgi:hypothetical protein